MKTKNDKRETTKEERKMERKRVLMIISLFLWGICLLVAGIGVWKAATSAPDSSQNQSSENDNKKNSNKKTKTEMSDTGDSIETWTVWTTDQVRLRAKANGDAEVLDVIPRNTELTASRETGEWVEVTYEKQEGFVSKEYITTEKPEDKPLSQVQRPAGPTGGHVICIDPGHQSSGDSTPEPNGPGSATMKARVTGGTSGRTTGVPEYQLNLAIGLQLQQELQARGYTVYMTRTSHDVNISNKERAEYATSVGAEITVRLHANGAENTGLSGALALSPSAGNPYVAHLANASQTLSGCVLNAYCSATGMNNQGVQANDTMTGINWCTMPVTILEMGYMTNPNDDCNMQDRGFQYNMVQGIANGIDQYFGY